MSYDITLVIDTGGAEPVEVYEDNYTSNVSPMWTKALGRPLASLDGHKAVDICSLLDRAVRHMEDNPGIYAAMDPENGWGDSVGATNVLEVLAAACREHPKTTLKVHH